MSKDKESIRSDPIEYRKLDPMFNLKPVELNVKSVRKRKRSKLLYSKKDSSYMEYFHNEDFKTVKPRKTGSNAYKNSKFSICTSPSKTHKNNCNNDFEKCTTANFNEDLVCSHIELLPLSPEEAARNLEQITLPNNFEEGAFFGKWNVDFDDVSLDKFYFLYSIQPDRNSEAYLGFQHDHIYTSIHGETYDPIHDEVKETLRSMSPIRKVKKQSHQDVKNGPFFGIQSPPFPYVYIPLHPDLGLVLEIGKKASCKDCIYEDGVEHFCDMRTNTVPPAKDDLDYSVGLFSDVEDDNCSSDSYFGDSDSHKSDVIPIARSDIDFELPEELCNLIKGNNEIQLSHVEESELPQNQFSITAVPVSSSPFSAKVTKSETVSLATENSFGQKISKYELAKKSLKQKTYFGGIGERKTGIPGPSIKKVQYEKEYSENCMYEDGTDHFYDIWANTLLPDKDDSDDSLKLFSDIDDSSSDSYFGNNNSHKSEVTPIARRNIDFELPEELSNLIKGKHEVQLPHVAEESELPQNQSSITTVSISSSPFSVKETASVATENFLEQKTDEVEYQNPANLKKTTKNKQLLAKKSLKQETNSNAFKEMITEHPDYFNKKEYEKEESDKKLKGITAADNLRLKESSKVDAKKNKTEKSNKESNATSSIETETDK